MKPHPRLLLLALALLFLAWPVAAKGKDKAPGPEDPTLTWETSVSSGWEDTPGTGLDYTLGAGQPRVGFDVQALVPLGPDPGSGLLFQGTGRGRFTVKDPVGSKPFLALVRTEGIAQGGARMAWSLDDLGTRGTLDALAGARIETRLDGDSGLVPLEADRGAFWTRVMPRGGFDLRSVTKMGPWRWENRGSVFLGVDAEEAYGRNWPALMVAASRSELTLAVVASGPFEGQLGLGGRVGWDSGIVASRREDREDFLADLLWGKHFALRLIPVRSSFQADGGAPGNRTWESGAEATVEAGSRTLTFGFAASWAMGPALALSLNFKEES